MLNVYVCEDDRKQLALFTKCIQNTILIEALDMQIVKSVTEPGEILDSLSATDPAEVLYYFYNLPFGAAALHLPIQAGGFGFYHKGIHAAGGSQNPGMSHQYQGQIYRFKRSFAAMLSLEAWRTILLHPLSGNYFF